MSAQGNRDIDRAHKLIVDLLRQGLLGVYDRLTVYEVFGTPKDLPPINILTVAIFEDWADITEDDGPVLLTGQRIRVDGYPNWTFGVARSYRLISRLYEALAAFGSGHGWALSGTPLAMGPLELVPPMFVPPDGTQAVPVNKVLKNNFWSGSHVIRFCDPNKTAFHPFLEDRRRLQSLSAAVSGHVPVALAGMADFLGDVVIQIPVTGIIANVLAPRDGGSMEVKVAWHPSVQPRNLRAAARMRSDTALTGASFSGPFTHSTTLSIASHDDPVEAEIWDEETGILLAATVPTSTISQIAINLRMVAHEPRVFSTRNPSGAPVAARISLFQVHSPTVVGTSRETSADRWRRRRSDLEEARRLEETRDFVQYRPTSRRDGEREKALADIRFLIAAHGERGIDLWDPYLSAEDLLQSLFWSPVIGAPLRAITDGRDLPQSASETPTNSAKQTAQAEPFAKRQRDTLIRNGGNLHGLRLEYRTRFGPKGWAFHDRFLIFPNLPNGPAAWSLGTSVNSLGKAHHILQRVSNGALVAGAFADLWAELDEPDHLIWRSW